MKSSELREKYLAFFESKGSKRMPSSSLIPDDPSLLLTSAGMVQFKPYFLQQKQLEAPFNGTTTVQKCVRTTDIDIIGTTGRHLSFFEMLGNFSFGSYFKEEMCAWAYEFSVDVLGFDPERLYFTVYLDDDETVEIWKKLGVPDDHIRRLDEKDNFWRAGPTGPCGPCSELYYDQGVEFGCDNPDCGPGCECARFLEYWNCVFTQFDAQEDGTLAPLPKKNIDTGMGLERTAAILQGVQSNYETDILRGLIAVGERLSGLTYQGVFDAEGTTAKSDLSLRIVADHARAVTFMIADGILPSNEGRGFVLRRLLRRAMRHGQLLGIEPPFLGEFISAVIDEMGSVYPELAENSGLILRIVTTEEERFAQTLRQGQLYLDQHLAALTAAADTETGNKTGNESPVLDGASAFELHDRFGFPLDLTIEIAAEQGIDVDRKGFEKHMSSQRERARAHAKDDAWGTFVAVYNEILHEQGATQFVGYEHLEHTAQVHALIVDGEQVSMISDGQKAQVILDATPFYGEMGGQLGDAGELLVIENGKNSDAQKITQKGSQESSQETPNIFIVEDTKVFEKAIFAHVGHITGKLSVGDTVHARIDINRRERIERNHTATHLLHYALQQVLGEHVKQAGSLVAPDHLRFDFTHFEAVSRTQLTQVEELVNNLIMKNSAVTSYETSLDDARAKGVTALFGEKYAEQVRVLEAGAESCELCGGTHVSHTAQIGFLKILGESSVGANMRRIEAVTSFDALAHVSNEEEQLRAAAALVKAAPAELTAKLEALLAHNKELEQELSLFRKAARAEDSSSLAATAVTVGAADADAAGAGGTGADAEGQAGGYQLVCARIDGLEVDDLRSTWDSLREALGDAAAAVLATKRLEGSPLILAAATARAVEGGFDAGAVIKHAAPLIKGGGGGKSTMAQAGGKDAAGLDAALDAARALLGVAPSAAATPTASAAIDASAATDTSAAVDASNAKEANK
ncbi:MAG: alanine--tRNA ligase [Coriobacteriales bacterium]|nr:alanine--tRNA ligase [Coriobacteriales bacterium]